MDKAPKGFWDYTEKWQKLFTEIRSVRWEGDWLENDYCAECRYCCGKQDSDYPFPMPLLPRQDRPDLDRDFHLLDCLTPCLDSRGCKSLTSHGCGRKLSEKPIACGLFPIVLANGCLYLYQNCPAVIFSPLIRFMEFGRKAAALLEKLDFEDLRRLSLWLNNDLLAYSYINLRIRIFDQNGKNSWLE